MSVGASFIDILIERLGRDWLADGTTTLSLRHEAIENERMINTDNSVAFMAISFFTNLLNANKGSFKSQVDHSVKR
jgi:hypothetical protein